MGKETKIERHQKSNQQKDSRKPTTKLKRRERNKFQHYPHLTAWHLCFFKKKKIASPVLPPHLFPAQLTLDSQDFLKFFVPEEKDTEKGLGVGEVERTAN